MSRDREIICVSEAMSPVTHSAGSIGNESVLSREAVRTPNGNQRIPFISGNQLRHRMVREPGWRWLIDLYDLKGKLTLSQLNFLMHGGSLTEGGPQEDLKRIADWQRIFPLGRLLGGCVPDQILEGTLRVHMGVLVCRENAERLRVDVGHVLPDAPLRPAASFLGGYQYTRASAGKRDAGLIADPSEPADSGLMIYAGESLIVGSVLVHGFSIGHPEPAELGALLWSLSLWRGAGSTIGGMSAKGHGRLATSIVSGIEADEADEAIRVYQAYAESVRAEAVAWLDAAFAKRPEKPGGKPKGKPKADPKPKPEPEAPVKDAGLGGLFGDEPEAA